MEYTHQQFVTDLSKRKTVEYFKSKPVPTNSYLWNVVRYSGDVAIIGYYLDKLPHDKAVYAAVVNNLPDIADYLISKGVTYNSGELRYDDVSAIDWAKQHGIDIHLEQVRAYTYDIDVTRVLLKNYPHLLQDMDLCRCMGNVLECILINYDVVPTAELVRSILKNDNIQCFMLIMHQINMHDYIREIAMASHLIIDFVVRKSNLTLSDFGMDLFSGNGVLSKVRLYASQIENFKAKAVECNLLQSLIDRHHTRSAIYLVQHYEICLPNLSTTETARAIILSDIDYSIADEFISDKESLIELRADIAKLSSIDDIINEFLNYIA